MELLFEPGFYEKVRIDDQGNIVDVDHLEENDLPAHSHKIEDLDSVELKNVISEILSTFFASPGDCAVQFSYDKNTQTISADVNIDEETISKNEYGQLVSGGGSTTIEPDVDGKVQSQIQGLKDSLPDLISKALSSMFSNTAESAVVFDWDEANKLLTADVKYDGVSIIRNEYGELQALGGSGDGSISTDCASHTHTSSQIEDFKEAVVNIFKDYSKNINIDLQNIIDGTTIKINQNGQLTAVRTALEKHTHLLEEIIDYVPPDPAAKQAMKDLGDVNFSRGVIDFSGLNIGYSILALSEYLGTVVDKRFEKLEDKLLQLSTSEDNPGLALLSLHKGFIKNNLYDTQEGNVKEVYYGPSIVLTLDYVPYVSGSISLLVNDQEVDVADIKELQNPGVTKGCFTVEKTYTKGNFTARVLSIVPPKIEKEGSVNYKVKFKEGTHVDFSTTLQLYATPYERVEFEFEDVSSTHKVGEQTYYDSPLQRVYKISIKEFEKYRFITNKEKSTCGISFEDEGTVTLPNLFGFTKVPVKFKYTEETSGCWLYQHLNQLNGGAVVNDVFVPNGRGYCSFTLPGSEKYNSVKIYDVPAEKLRIQKGSLKALGSVLATYDSPGVIPQDESDYVLLSFVDSYDNGRHPIELFIESTTPVDLSKIEFEFFNL